MAVTDLLLASDVDAYALTGDRVIATTSALVALAGAVAGGTAVVRTGRRLPVVALVAGLIGAVAGAVVVATADGGPGTGNGIVGGYAAVVLGLLGAALGGLASFRAGRGRSTDAGRSVS